MWKGEACRVKVYEPHKRMGSLAVCCNLFWPLMLLTSALVKGRTDNVEPKIPQGHLQPLGSHVPPEPVDVTLAENIISPVDFASKYVVPRRPLVMRNVVKNWPAYSKWTEEYLKETYPTLELRLEKKVEAASEVPVGDVCRGRDTFRHFLHTYRDPSSNKYVVSELPTPMWHEVYIPPPVSCGEFLNSFVEIDLWVNSDVGKKNGGGRSLLHKDAYNTINCVLKGSKEWKLIELQYNDLVYQAWESPHDRGWGGYSLINPQKVDMVKFPRVADIPRWQLVTINEGDCLYLPSQMWHQVNSYGEQNMAVAFLFDMYNQRDHLNVTGCNKSVADYKLSDVDVALQYPGHGVMQMGHPLLQDISSTFPRLFDRKAGYMTLKSVYMFVRDNHFDDESKELVKEKAKTLHKLLQTFLGCRKEDCTEDKLTRIKRPQIREMLGLILPVEPANTCDYEYYDIEGLDLQRVIEKLMSDTEYVSRKDFLNAYMTLGGTEKFGLQFWAVMVGDETLSGISKASLELRSESIATALQPYFKYVHAGYSTEEDDEATVYTPQGHKTQPKKYKGGYNDFDDYDDALSTSQESRKTERYREEF